MKLYKGNIISAGAKSPYSLYSQEYVTFGADEVYNQADASGFINLFGLPLTVRALMKQGKLKIMAKLWGGRFSKIPMNSVDAFNASIEFDKRLYHEDIRGSIAHAQMLGKCGIIPAEDVEKIVAGLETILADIEAGNFSFEVALEDIHMNIEARLTERIGAAGARLHTARSRNDQVALDMHMYMKREIVEIGELLLQFEKALLAVGQKT